jgi:hypothetical protein
MRPETNGSPREGDPGRAGSPHQRLRQTNHGPSYFADFGCSPPGVAQERRGESSKSKAMCKADAIFEHCSVSSRLGLGSLSIPRCPTSSAGCRSRHPGRVGPRGRLGPGRIDLEFESLQTVGATVPAASDSSRGGGTLMEPSSRGAHERPEGRSHDFSRSVAACLLILTD